MKSKLKIVIDIGMIILILIQMAYHLIGDSLHGWIGMILFVLIILHNILDRRWYSGLCKGKYTLIRFFHTAINLLLLTSFLGLATSAVFLSTTLSALFHLKAAMIGRRMHMVFTAWSFVLMSIHVGLHWNGIAAIFNKCQKRSNASIAFFKCLISILSTYGLYAFISRNLLQHMFLQTEYVFFNYNETLFSCIMDYTSILCLFSFSVYHARKLICRK